MVILFVPSFKASVVLNEPLKTGTIFPLMVTLTAVESLTVPEIIMDERFTLVESRGDNMTSVGAMRSTMTVLEIVVLFPAASVTTIAILFVPSARFTVVLNEPFETGTLLPLIVKATAVESETVPLTAIDDVFVIKLSFGDWLTHTGG